MSLVTVDRYRAITGDEITAASAVSGFVEEAAALLEDDLGRPLEEAERTESMWPDRAGWLWPLATPIVTADGWTIDGHALRAGQWSVNPWPNSSDSISVTYTGGFVERTANPSADNRLPATIERDLAWAAYALGSVDEILAGLPAGTTSASVGDISISFDRGARGSADDMRIRWSRVTRRYRRRGV